MGAGQNIINHLINDHNVAPWQVWGAFEAQHDAKHTYPCDHTHEEKGTENVS